MNGAPGRLEQKTRNFVKVSALYGVAAHDWTMGTDDANANSPVEPEKRENIPLNRKMPGELKTRALMS